MGGHLVMYSNLLYLVLDLFQQQEAAKKYFTQAKVNENLKTLENFPHNVKSVLEAPSTYFR